MSQSTTETAEPADKPAENVEIAEPVEKAASATAEPAEKSAEEGSVADLPEWAQKIISKTRSEAAENRTRASAAVQKQNETLAAVAKALGLDDAEADSPEKLSEELTRSRAQARQAAIELAVVRTAGKANADVDALLDSRSFLASVETLDPNDPDFATNVEDAVRSAVSGNSRLLLTATQAGPRSGADHGTGGTGAVEVSESEFRKMSGHERNKLATDNPSLYARLSGRA